MKNTFTLVLLLFTSLFFKSNAQNLHIKLEGAILTKEESQQIQESLQLQLGFYDDLFGGEVDKKLSVRVYGKYDEYKKYAVEECNFTPTSHAFYSPKKDVMVIYKDKYFLPTFFHEMSHAILQKKCPSSPIWLNEGLADYFGSLKYTNEGFENVVSGYRIQTILTMSSHEDKLKDFVLLPYAAWQKMDDSMAYGLSWGIVFYLYYSQMDAFRKIVKNICEGQNSVQAIENGYPGGFKTFFKSFRKYYISKK